LTLAFTLTQVYGGTANLQLLSGNRQFLRLRFEDLAMNPWQSLKKT
jgi:hypothetical protein